MRRFSYNEIFKHVGANNSILYNDTYLNALGSLIKPIVDSDGQEVDSDLWDWLTMLHNTFAYEGSYAHELDRMWSIKNGDLITVKKYESVTDAIEDIQERSSSILLSKLDDITRLYYALQLPYNPLYNKDATETLTQSGTITDTHTGEDDIATIGTTQDASSSTSSGKRNGQTLMESKVTTEDSTVPYNNTTHYDIDKSETTTPVMGTDGTATNSVDYHNTTDYDSALEHAYDKTDTKRAYGNLGVTKSTDLLESEYQTRIKHNFWAYVYDLCLKDQFMREVVLSEY